MANDLQRFENVMDEMLVNGKVMDEIMNKNTLSSDSTAEAMMQNLKMELALEVLFCLFRHNNSMKKLCSSSKCRSKNKWTKTFKTSLEIFDYMHNLFYYLEYLYLNNSGVGCIKQHKYTHYLSFKFKMPSHSSKKNQKYCSFSSSFYSTPSFIKLIIF